MNSIFILIIGIICLFPAIIILGSGILLILKIIERIKEKENEDFDKYDKY